MKRVMNFTLKVDDRVYMLTIYKISDGKIQEEVNHSYDASGKTAFVYNRPKTIHEIMGFVW